jgi:predicted small metal-binding protein
VPLVADELEARCDCGWSARGPERDLVPKIQQHARDVHGLDVTREQALAQARPVESE